MDKMREVLIDRTTDNLLALRKKANITQTELAGMIGVSKFTILSIEKKTAENDLEHIPFPAVGIYQKQGNR